MNMDAMAEELTAMGIPVQVIGRELQGTGTWDGLTISEAEDGGACVAWDGEGEDDGSAEVVDATAEVIAAAAHALAGVTP